MAALKRSLNTGDEGNSKPANENKRGAAKKSTAKKAAPRHAPKKAPAKKAAGGRRR
jgi:hypothetical protein